MVYIIVEVEQTQIQDIINRLLGARYKVTVVDDLATACGCENEKPPPAKRRLTEETREAASSSSCIVSSSKPASSADLNALVSRVYTEANKKPYEDINQYGGTGISTFDELLYVLGDASTSSTSAKPLGNEHKRNNGVPYNSNAITPQDEYEEERPYTESMDGVDMAIRCTLCDRVIALGTRPANHSTRKYAHARNHGFKNRFECSVCHTVFKNKRVTFNHHKTIHPRDTTFRIIDNWTEESQRELIQMVKKCFPKDNKPFAKKVTAQNHPQEEDRESDKEIEYIDLKAEMDCQ